MFLFEAFYRKLINRGMPSCAKLIAGQSWHSSEYVFTFRAYAMSLSGLSIQTVQNMDCFSSSNKKGRKKRFGCGAAQREPAKVPFEITHETESGDSGALQMFWSTSNTNPWFRKTSQPGAHEGKVWGKHMVVFKQRLKNYRLWQETWLPSWFEGP